MANKTIADIIYDARNGGATGEAAVLAALSNALPDVNGPTFAAIGDSMTDQNTRWILPPLASPSSAWFSDGPLSWFRILSHQRINFPLSHELGVSGDTFEQILARVDQVFNLSPKPDYCVVLAGANNISLTTSLGSFESMRDKWLKIVTSIKERGIIPITMPAPPRAGSTLTTAQVLTQHRLTAFQREFCRKNKGYLFCDYLKYFIDQASATGAPLALMVKADNLHPAATGAFYMGKAMAELMDMYLPDPASSFFSAMDYYDATSNPTGSLLHSGATNYSTMAGTTGTHTASSGFTTSGNLATGFTSIKSGGTSTMAATCSKESRTDGWASGALQVVAISVTGAGGADEIHNLRATPVFADVAPGDWVYAEVKVDVTGAPVNLNALELYLLESRPSNSQTAVDMNYNAATSLLVPAVTWSGTLRTPPIQIQSNSTALQVNLRSRFNTTSGTAGITYKATDYVVRKVDPTLI